MIKLVACIGFLSVFGLVGYAIVLLLTKAFNSEEKKSKENESNSINQKTKKENGTK